MVYLVLGVVLVPVIINILTLTNLEDSQGFMIDRTADVEMTFIYIHHDKFPLLRL